MIDGCNMTSYLQFVIHESPTMMDCTLKFRTKINLSLLKLFLQGILSQEHAIKTKTKKQKNKNVFPHLTISTQIYQAYRVI